MLPMFVPKEKATVPTETLRCTEQCSMLGCQLPPEWIAQMVKLQEENVGVLRSGCARTFRPLMALGTLDFVIAWELLSKVSCLLGLAGLKHSTLGGYMRMNQASTRIGIDMWCLKSSNKPENHMIPCEDRL